MDRKAVAALIRDGRLPDGIPVPTERGVKTRWLYDDIETCRRILRSLNRFRRTPRQEKSSLVDRRKSGEEKVNRARGGANGGKLPGTPEA